MVVEALVQNPRHHHADDESNPIMAFSPPSYLFSLQPLIRSGPAAQPIKDERAASDRREKSILVIAITS